MTEYYDSDYEDAVAGPAAAGPGRRSLGVLATLLGAALCVALIGGGAWWATGIGERQASDLPVFRASLDPVKERPEDPGGVETPYQELRSFEVAAGSVATERDIVLAPAPDGPAGEDLAMAELGGVEPLATDAAPAEPGVEVEGIATGIPPVPRARPSNLVTKTAELSQQAIDEATQLAAKAAISAVQIQLGAYTDREFTESEWYRIAERNDDILEGRALAIQSTVSGGTRFYRLRVGPFRDRAEADSLCKALRARGQDCLVAVNG